MALVARVHHGTGNGETSLAGRSLAAQSKLPKIIAENLGAGFGQWDWFPEVKDIVDFALAYAPPTNEEEVWALARTWASDDAAGRHTLMALVGREIVMHELKRIDIPKLREVVSESRASRVRELRESLGLAVPAPKGEKRTRPTAAKAEGPARAPAGGAPRAIPTRMPLPERKPRAEAVAVKAEVKRFTHPKFGEGTLEAKDGEGPEAKLTIKFGVGTKTLQAKFVTEV